MDLSIFKSFVVQTALLTGALFYQSAAHAILINEIRIDQTGTDTDEYFELMGNANESLDGLSYLVIGDGSGGSGVIESVTHLSGYSLSAGGLFLAAESSFTLAPQVDLSTTLGFENSDNVTHLLVNGFSGSLGDDLDGDDDGVLDMVPWLNILDSVALLESTTSGERVYSSVHLGPTGGLVPAHVYRAAQGGPWQMGSMTPGQDTPGAHNMAVPEPASLALFLLGLLYLWRTKNKLGKQTSISINAKQAIAY